MIFKKITSSVTPLSEGQKVDLRFVSEKGNPEKGHQIAKCCSCEVVFANICSVETF